MLRKEGKGSAFSPTTGLEPAPAPVDQLYAFGWNGAGQLGTGDTDNKKTACAVEPLADKRVAIVACGGPYTVLATDTEEVWGFGANARCVPPSVLSSSFVTNGAAVLGRRKLI